MHVYDTALLVFITAFNGFGMSLFILKSFFQGVSWEYAEAVFIDGGGHFTVFFKVMLPQAIPVALVFFINNFLAQYTDYMSKLLYMPSFVTIAVGLYYESMLLPRIGETPIYFAALFMSCIPILAIYIFLGKRMMTSMNIGGLKG
jgi:ABC-type glycerol-3-phosphate transport system permease component